VPQLRQHLLAVLSWRGLRLLAVAAQVPRADRQLPRCSSTAGPGGAQGEPGAEQEGARRAAKAPRRVLLLFFIPLTPAKQAAAREGACQPACCPRAGHCCPSFAAPAPGNGGVRGRRLAAAGRGYGQAWQQAAAGLGLSCHRKGKLLRHLQGLDLEWVGRWDCVLVASSNGGNI
jgi:hypothetical protein